MNLGGMVGHLRAFQEAADLSGGTRASGLQGYGVTRRLRGRPAARRRLQPDRPDLRLPVLQAALAVGVHADRADADETFVEGTDFDIMSYSGHGRRDRDAGRRSTSSSPTPNTSTSGCEAADFAAARSAARSR